MQHRAFIAILVSDQAHRELVDTQAMLPALMPKDVYRKFNPEPGLYHVTLRFLGDCSDLQIKKLDYFDPVSRTAVKPLKKTLELGLGSLDCFPDDEDEAPKILYCDLLGEMFLV